MVTTHINHILLDVIIASIINQVNRIQDVSMIHFINSPKEKKKTHILMWKQHLKKIQQLSKKQLLGGRC